MLQLLDYYQLKAELYCNTKYRVTATYSTVLLYILVNLKGTDKFLMYRRPPGRGKFSDLHAIGYCGKVEVVDHIYDNEDNVDVFATIEKGGLRELEEEVVLADGVESFTSKDLKYVGICSGRPAAVVALVEYEGDESDITVCEPENIHVGWKTVEQIRAMRDEIEGWSAIVIDSISHLVEGSKVSLENKTVVWKKIPGYSRYLAGSDGTLRNLKTGGISKGGDAGRYLKVSVYKDGESTPHLEYLHILICTAFKGKRPKGTVVLHKDNDRTNVKPANLRWGTQSENIKDAYDDGLIGSKHLRK